MNENEQNKSLRHRRIMRDMTEQGYLQWALMRSLTFGERDWIIICACLFLLDTSREFLTLPGVMFTICGIFFMGPVYGICIYMTAQFVFNRKKKKKALPKTFKAFKIMMWKIHLCWLPVMILTSYAAFNLFYDIHDSLPTLQSPMKPVQKSPGQQSNIQQH